MTTFKLNITKEANEYLWAYIEATMDEVGGFGFVHREGDEWTWYETFIVKQGASGAEVDYGQGEGLAQALARADEAGLLNDPQFSWVSWHSHNTMSAYWSSTDESAIKKFREVGMPHLFSFVGNHKYEYKLRLDLFDHPLMKHIKFEGGDLVVARDGRIVEAVNVDLETLVTKPKPKAWSGGWKKGDDDKSNPAHPQHQMERATSQMWWDEIDWQDPIEREIGTTANWWDEDEAEAALALIEAHRGGVTVEPKDIEEVFDDGDQWCECGTLTEEKACTHKWCKWAKGYDDTEAPKELEQSRS